MSALVRSRYRVVPRAPRRLVPVGPCIVRRRDGRLLVECLVAMLLVAIGAASLAGTTRAIALLADDAALVTRAQAQASAAAESLHIVACITPSATRLTERGRVALAVTASRSGALQRTDVVATPRTTPLAGRTLLPLTLSAGRACP